MVSEDGGTTITATDTMDTMDMDMADKVKVINEEQKCSFDDSFNPNTIKRSLLFQVLIKNLHFFYIAL